MIVVAFSISAGNSSKLQKTDVHREISVLRKPPPFIHLQTHNRMKDLHPELSHTKPNTEPVIMLNCVEFIREQKLNEMEYMQRCQVNQLSLTN